MKFRSGVAELFRMAAEETASPLLELAGLGRAADPARFGARFRKIRARFAALPVPNETYGLLTNMVADVEALIARLEFGAARWQLRQTVRRLRRLEKDWEGDTVPTGGPVKPAWTW